MLALGAIPIAAAGGSTGALDPAFSGDGLVTTNVPYGSAAAKGIVRQPDGKLVVVGDSDDAWGLLRYNPDGSLDSSFGSGGKQLTRFVAARAVALQDDGKLVVVGDSGSPGSAARFTVARHNINGSLDTSFGNGGRVLVNFSGGTGGGPAAAVVVQPDGKIVVAGASSYMNDGFGVARLMPEGSLDPTFGDGGKATVTGPDQETIVTALAVDSEGRVVVGGIWGYGADAAPFTVVRFTTGGSLDGTFGSGGVLTVDLNGGRLSALAAQPDGKLIAAGYDSGSGAGDYGEGLVVRILSNGALDPGFGAGGKSIITFPSHFHLRAIGRQTDGRLVLAGGGGLISDFAIARLTPAGDLDTSFDGDGRLLVSMGADGLFGGPIGEAAEAVAVEPATGQIAVAGTLITTGPNALGVVRITPAGTLDTDFDGDGRVTTHLSAHDRVRSVLRLLNGKFVAFGDTASKPNGDWSVAQYATNGSLERLDMIDVGGTDRATKLLPLDDGGFLVIGGSTRHFDSSAVVAKFANDGTRDLSFGDEGYARIPGIYNVWAAVRQGGKILIAASELWTSTNKLVRLNTNGSLDTTFGTNGWAIVSAASQVNRLTVTPEGGLLMLATVSNTPTLLQYTDSGVLDSSLDGDGEVSLDMTAADVAVMPTGRIVVGGSISTGFTSELALARYDPDGTMDSSFGTNGTATLDVGDTARVGRVILRPDGRILVAGTKQVGGLFSDWTSAFVVAQFTPAGVPDISFGTEGASIGAFDPTGTAVDATLVSDKLVVAGSALVEGSHDFALARYDVGPAMSTETPLPPAEEQPPPPAAETTPVQATQPPTQSETPTPQVTPAPAPQSAPAALVKAPSVSSTRRCLVPALKGKSLKAAKRALVAANCRAGRITRKRARAKVGRVVSQSQRPGATRAKGTRIALVLGRR